MSKFSLKTSQYQDWTIQLLEARKAQIKAEILDWRSTFSKQQTLAKILGRIKETNQKHDSDHYLSCIIYCISAAVHHEAFGGLNERQQAQIFEMADSILKVKGIQSKRSHFACLHSDLHTIRGQIKRKGGNHWVAAWEQHLAKRAGGQFYAAGQGYHDFSMGNRFLRLGSKKMALAYYQAASAEFEKTGNSNDSLLRIQINQILISRISGDVELAKVLIDNLRLRCGKDERLAIDLDWEQLCCQAQETGDLRPMLQATKRGLPHDKSSYIVEQVLWGMCFQKRDWLKELANLGALYRTKGGKVKSIGPFFDIVFAIQRAYDFSMPIDVRIKDLGEQLPRIPAIISVDKELLIWLAAARLLVRLRSYEMARLCLFRYEALSLTLTGGGKRDCLGLASDLLEAAWYEHPENAAEISEEEQPQEKVRKRAS